MCVSVSARVCVCVSACMRARAPACKHSGMQAICGRKVPCFLITLGRGNEAEGGRGREQLGQTRSLHRTRGGSGDYRDRSKSEGRIGWKSPQLLSKTERAKQQSRWDRQKSPVGPSWLIAEGKGGAAGAKASGTRGDWDTAGSGAALMRDSKPSSSISFTPFSFACSHPVGVPVVSSEALHGPLLTYPLLLRVSALLPLLTLLSLVHSLRVNQFSAF